jgi:signal transduction histidine kinase
VFTRLRWLSILVPVALVVAIETVSDTLLDAALPFPLDTFLIAAAVLVVAAVLSWVAFRDIGRLTRRLEAQNTDLARRTVAARGLEEVSVSVAAGAEIGPTLATVVERARVMLRADVTALVATVAGVAPICLVEPAVPAPPSEIAGSGDIEGWLEREGFGSFLATPIRMGSAVVGSLTAGQRTTRAFDVDDVETLTALASMAAVAIRNHDLRAAMRDLAVRGERERIAREMHDGLAQVLAYVSAKSAAAEQLLEAGRIREAQGQMTELGRVARSTYVDVRESILGLATPISPEHGLTAALAAYAKQFADASKLATDVSATAAAQAAELAPEAEAQAFRIVQEALTNVRKHADAARASIHLAVESAILVVTVEDDGRGFSSEVGGPRDWPHYGLSTMTARAAEAGGAVSWSPRAGGGTHVELRLPILRSVALVEPVAPEPVKAGAA